MSNIQIDTLEIIKENKVFFDNSPDITVPMFIHSNILSNSYNQINFDLKPNTRIAVEMGMMLHAKDFPNFEPDFKIVNNYALWDAKVAHDIYPKTFTSYTTDTFSSVYSFFYAVLDKKNTKANFDNYTQTHKDALSSFINVVKSSKDFRLSQLLFKHLSQISAFEIIKENYDYFKITNVLQQEEASKLWKKHIADRGSLKYGNDVIDTFDYAAEFNKLFMNKGVSNKNFTPCTELILLAIKADSILTTDKTNILNDDLEGDLKCNTSMVTKIFSALKALRVVKPDVYKNLFFQYSRNIEGKITAESLFYNDRAGLLLAKCSNVYLSDELLETHTQRLQVHAILNFKSGKTQEIALDDWVETVSTTVGWRGIAAAIINIDEPEPLIKAASKIKQTHTKEPNYQEIVDTYMHKIYRLDDKVKEKFQNVISELISDMFEVKDVELVESLNLSTTDAYNMLYSKKYLNDIESLELPHLENMVI